MTPVHVHLLLNHVPVLGGIFGLLILVAGVVRHSAELKTAGMVTLVIAALVTVPVFLSGEAAEDIAEGLPGVTEAVIESHEAAAKVALAAVSVSGLLALLTLIIGRGSVGPGRPLATTVLVAAIISTGLLVRAAGLGGQVRHSEIRGNALSAEDPDDDDDKEKADGDNDDDRE